MPFGQTGGTSGPIMPRIKYNAQSGRAFRLDREQVNGEWQTNEVDISQELAFLVARESLRKGWANFKTFDKVLVEWGESLPPRPDGQDDQGKPDYAPFITMIVKLAPKAGGDVREFSGSSMTLIKGLEPVIDGWAGYPEAADLEQCPIVKLAGVAPYKNECNNATLYAPDFTTIGWRPRPEDLHAPEVKQEEPPPPSDDSEPDWDSPHPVEDHQDAVDPNSTGDDDLLF